MKTALTKILEEVLLPAGCETEISSESILGQLERTRLSITWGGALVEVHVVQLEGRPPTVTVAAPAIRYVDPEQAIRLGRLIVLAGEIAWRVQTRPVDLLAPYSPSC